MYSLSKLFDFGNLMGMFPTPYNPVRLIPRKRRPKEASHEARFLEVAESAQLLEAARTIEPARSDACPFLFPLLATYLLTGGRKSEVLGLEVDDVSFDRKTITFRPNAHRRLKNRGSARVVTLWPQLEEILRPYIFPADRAPWSGLLFRGEARGGQTQMLTDFRKALAPALTAAKIAGKVTPKVFRHTYCSARLQTLDNGRPVSPYTVSGELGHGSLAMVERIYGHLGTVRHRSEVVEYRVKEQPCDKPVVTNDISEVAKSFKRS
jgi:integrase